jgi:hypothetical protein
MQWILGDCQRGEPTFKVKRANLGLGRANVYAQQ